MTRLTETQSLILSAAAQRPGAVALPLPKGLHGAAAKKVVTMLITRGWLAEVAANPRSTSARLPTFGVWRRVAVPYGRLAWPRGDALRGLRFMRLPGFSGGGLSCSRP
jgi:hypothetical protein